jgi:transposase
LGGETDPVVLADLARGRLRAKLPALRQALAGRLQPQHVVVIGQILAHIDFLDEAIAALHDAIERDLAPYRTALDLLLTIPGVREVGAATLIAELGVEMARFPSAKHLASWAGLCPGNKQSGGKRLSGKTTKGNGWLRAVLIEIAWANARRKEGYLAAQFRRLVRRRGVYKAIIAVAHSLLVIIYHMLRDQRPFADLGADYFDRLEAKRLEQHHVRRLNALGYGVTLTPLPPAEPVSA